jgi:hypothetical protein
MYESGHSPAVEELQHALRRLDAVLAEHHRRLSEGGVAQGMERALRRDLQMMREEADRLRAELAAR